LLAGLIPLLVVTDCCLAQGLEGAGMQAGKSTSVDLRRTFRNVMKARGTDEVHWLGRRENP
jgi:hypothetical protein